MDLASYRWRCGRIAESGRNVAIYAPPLIKGDVASLRVLTIRRALVSACGLLVLSCGGGGGNSGGGGPTAPPVDNSVGRVDISPTGSIALVSGATSTLSATAFTKSNQSLGASGISWTSSNDAVASVVGGVVTAKLVGSATITASSGSISSAGVTVTVSAGAASQLGIRTQPGGAASAVALSTQPVIEVRDAAGNVIATSTAAVTVAIASGGGALAGSATVAAVAGVATFSGLGITGLIGARALSFTAAGLTTATSASFTLAAGAPTQLAVRTQPVAGSAYQNFTTLPVIEIQDAQGNLTTSTATVTAAIASGGGTLVGPLFGTPSITALSGVATFAVLVVQGSAGPRTLTFTSPALTAVTTASFNVSEARPAVIGFSPIAVNISAVAGRDPASTIITVTNSGVFPLTNLRVLSITYSPLSPTGWLTTTFPTGTSLPANLQLAVTSSTFAVGTYVASVVVAGDGAVANATLTVTLTVAPTLTNTYGTTSNKISLLALGATLTPALTTTSGTGVATTVDPTVTFVSRSPAIATVDATGKITAVAAGQAWIVAASTQASADSVHVIVPRANGIIVRTDLTNYRYRIGDTVTVRIQLDTRGATLGAATVTFSWPAYTGAGDYNALAFLNVSTALSPLAPVVVVDQSLNVMRLTGASVAGVTGVVDLATVRFRMQRVGVLPLYVNAIELIGTDLSNLLATATSTQYPLSVP